MVQRRAFDSTKDYDAISEFLFAHHQAGNGDGNWLQPIWEYAYTHPWFDESAVDRIGVWEQHGQIVAVVTYEMRLGEAFLQTAAGFDSLKPKMLMHAEEYLAGKTDDGADTLRVYVNDFDRAFEQYVASRGYERLPESDRPMSHFAIPAPFPDIHLPPGFRVKSLQEENDLRKVHRVLWRGFDHPGDPDEDPDGIAGRQRMQSGPHFRADLTTVVEAPGGDFVSYCGMWYDAVNRYGYVEPVATDPDYRRRGLGRAAVLDAIRRCGEAGATVVYVGTDKPFYLSFGFERLSAQHCWVKRIDDRGRR